MNILCNGESTNVNDNISLYTLLDSKDIATKKGIAVAVNNSVVQRQDWSSCNLRNNDSVLIISATKGG